MSPCCSDRDWRKAFGQPSRGLTSRQMEERRKAGLSGRAVKSPNSNRGTQHRGTHTGNGALFGPHKTSSIRRLFTLRVAYTCWEHRFRAGTLDLLPTSLCSTRQSELFEGHNGRGVQDHLYRLSSKPGACTESQILAIGRGY